MNYFNPFSRFNHLLIEVSKQKKRNTHFGVLPDLT